MKQTVIHSHLEVRIMLKTPSFQVPVLLKLEKLDVHANLCYHHAIVRELHG